MEAKEEKKAKKTRFALPKVKEKEKEEMKCAAKDKQKEKENEAEKKVWFTNADEEENEETNCDEVANKEEEAKDTAAKITASKKQKEKEDEEESKETENVKLPNTRSRKRKLSESTISRKVGGKSPRRRSKLNPSVSQSTSQSDATLRRKKSDQDDEHFRHFMETWSEIMFDSNKNVYVGKNKDKSLTINMDAVRTLDEDNLIEEIDFEALKKIKRMNGSNFLKNTKSISTNMQRKF